MYSKPVALAFSLLSTHALIAQIEWTQRSLPEPRAGAAMVYDSSRQRLVVFGGENYAGAPLDAVWEWDGQTWSSHLPAVRPPAGSGAMAFDTARGVTVLHLVFPQGTWEWDGSTWTNPAPGTSSPVYGPMAHDSARAVTVMLDCGSSPGPTTREWDGANWSLVSTLHTPPSRSGGSLVYDAARSVCVLQGGFDGVTGTILNDTWTYDGTDWVQRSPLQVPDASAEGAGFAYDPVRQVCVYYCGDSVVTSDTWEWDGSNWSPVASSTSPPLRSGACTAFDGLTNAVTIFGGETPAASRADLWRFNGSTWTEDEATGSPEHAQGSLVHDSIRQTTVLFAYEGTGAGDASTWETMGAGWLQVATIHTPTANAGTCMAYDAIRQRVVLFGGYRTGVGTLDETWTYDGIDWSRHQPTVVPNASEDAVMAFDEARGVAVLFDQAGSTWTWNGSNWQLQVTPVAPSPRQFAAMAYDRLRERVVMFGGWSLPPNDTWEWDGATWTQAQPVHSPPAGIDTNTMDYDPVRARSVLFATYYAGGSATWEWDGVDWSPRQTSIVPTGRPQGLIHDHLHNRNTLLTANGMFPYGVARTWDLEQTVASAVTLFGSGCPGTFGVPALEIAGPHAVVGRPYGLTFVNLPPNQVLISVLSTSRLAQPVDLAVLGMPGCDALIAPDFLFGHVTTTSFYLWPLMVPNDPQLLSFTFYCQGLVTDPVTHPLVTNAIELVVGSN